MVARHDLTEDPQILEGLLQVRRGTAFFARKLNELNDADLDEPSLLPGWTRRHLVSHVGYNARAVARLVEWAATGVETPMYSSPEARGQEIEFGATLQPIALRHLFEHSAIHLNVEWRDLPAEAWGNMVKTAQGRTVPASETVWMRTREVWLHAVDLNNGAHVDDIPQEVSERLLKDITGAWRTRETDAGLRVIVEGTDLTFGDPDSEATSTTITGSLAGVLEWASGRGVSRVSADGAPQGQDVPPAPRWI